VLVDQVQQQAEEARVARLGKRLAHQPSTVGLRAHHQVAATSANELNRINSTKKIHQQ